MPPVYCRAHSPRRCLCERRLDLCCGSRGVTLRGLRERPWVQFAAVAILTLGALPLVVGRLASPLGLKAGDGLVLGTGLIIIWYTIETHGMRRQLVRQNETAVRPVVITQLD